MGLQDDHTITPVSEQWDLSDTNVFDELLKPEVWPTSVSCHSCVVGLRN